MSRHFGYGLRSGVGLLCGLLAADLCGCESGDPDESEIVDEGGFVSANPGSMGAGRSQGYAEDAALGGGDASGATGSHDAPAFNSGSDSVAATIAEADIIQIESSRLFAMSRYGGLSVIDISEPDSLRVLGRYKIVAEPFEMYVRDGVVLGLYRGYGEYVEEDGGASAWVQTSRVVVVDATEPASMTRLDEFEVPGSISDSRIVGDILYVASYENGDCWRCQEDKPRTAVVSLDVTDPKSVSKVDELSFEESAETYSWKRSITVNDQRMYVAGPRWGDDGPIGSEIQVVDISDRAGQLVAGASVEVNGQVNSRWQMDEHEGVLRVVTQPGAWDLSEPPVVETFEVASASELNPLGETTLKLPRPERLESARFDALRGYVITAEQTDPLIVIDLSHPDQPRQAGELEMPGWVYHLEPRGDRLLGLGYDQQSEDGAVTVSLFDVSNIDQPALLSRVNFGGDWASLPEDQDRIHKAFNVLDADGLILVPFSGTTYSYPEVVDECKSRGSWLSGVQLVDWKDDELTRRGVAPSVGDARRGIIHEKRLLTVSDERVESFDISDRDAPEHKSSAVLAQYVSQVVAAGDHVVRVGQNWWTQSSSVDVVATEEAALPAQTPTLEVTPSEENCNGYLRDALGDEAVVRLVIEGWQYDSAAKSSWLLREIVTLDVSEPTAPEELGRTTLRYREDYESSYFAVADTGKSVVQVGNALAFQHHVAQYDHNVETYEVTVLESGVQVVDLENPSKPKTTLVKLPSSLGRTGLIASGDLVVRSRWSASSEDARTVRFYLDRIDLSDPAKPRALATVSLPGALLAFDADSGHAVTVDFRLRIESDITEAECQDEYADARWTTEEDEVDYEKTPGTCTATLQTLRLIRIEDTQAEILGSVNLGPKETVNAAAVGKDRVFVQLGSYGGVSTGVGVAVAGGAFDCYGCGWYSFESPPVSIVTLGGIHSGKFSHGRIEIDSGDTWGSVPIVASGQRAALSTGRRGQLTVIDAANAAKPEIVRELELAGYVEDLAIVDGKVVAALGYDGVQTLSLGD